MPAPIIPGAEPWSAGDGPHGALVLHGFTGNPSSMRGLAEVLHHAGFAVDLPLLPGHGTSVEDMIATGWADWLGAATEALARLSGRLPDEGRVVVVGLSMGASITAWLGGEHPGLAGLVCINPIVFEPPNLRPVIQGFVDAGGVVIQTIASDIALPGVKESAYADTPLVPLLSLFEAADGMAERMGRIECPVLIMTSRNDHVVPPENSDVLAVAVKGPVERVFFDRSYHVATLDYDRDDVERLTVDFALRAVAAAGFVPSP
ncbi:MAG: alpha/beta hydrolase [Acidimicrobiia bacterium]